MCGFYTSCFFFKRRVTKVSIIGFISVFVKGAGEWVQLLVSASCTLWLLNTTLYIQRNKNNEAMPLSLYWTEISLIQQAEVRTWHVLSHKGFFFLPHSLEFSICLTLSIVFLVSFFYLHDNAKTLITHQTSIGHDFIRNFVYLRIIESTPTWIQMNQMQLQFDQCLQILSKQINT